MWIIYSPLSFTAHIPPGGFFFILFCYRYGILCLLSDCVFGMVANCRPPNPVASTTVTKSREPSLWTHQCALLYCCLLCARSTASADLLHGPSSNGPWTRTKKCSEVLPQCVCTAFVPCLEQHAVSIREPYERSSDGVPFLERTR